MMPGLSERLKFELERTLEPAPNGVKPPVVVWKPVLLYLNPTTYLSCRTAIQPQMG